MSADAPDPSLAAAAADVEGAAPGKPLSPAARRALEEAAARRAASALESAQAQAENGEEGGPSGPEPTRFGDWERKGIAVDF
jgi:hypothetical protein